MSLLPDTESTFSLRFPYENSNFALCPNPASSKPFTIEDQGSILPSRGTASDNFRGLLEARVQLEIPAGRRGSKRGIGREKRKRERESLAAGNKGGGGCWQAGQREGDQVDRRLRPLHPRTACSGRVMRRSLVII